MKPDGRSASVLTSAAHRLVILGAGTAGTMMANKLRAALDDNWKITIVDKHQTHYYQPGFLFIPFGLYSKQDVIKSKNEFIPKGVNLITAETERIDPDRNIVVLANGHEESYDLLIIATGAVTRPDETEGLESAYQLDVAFDFYTLKGSLKLRDFFSGWNSGKLVVCIAEMPIKCPVAPIEFLFLADWYFKLRGIRETVTLELVTPLDGAFTKPVCSNVLGHLFEEKGIRLSTEFALSGVDPASRRISDWGGSNIDFDCLVMVPVNMGDEVIARSGLGDDLNFVPTDPSTLQSRAHENIFVIGDATDLPSSKAGSVAHFQAEILTENIIATTKGQPLTGQFDGHANCFIESGFDRAIMVDFNYNTEPLPGKYPLPYVGPFDLLRESRINHQGKLAFKWLYWNILLRGRKLPVPTLMSMSGKQLSAAAIQNEKLK